MDADLAGLRDKDPLDKLPESERQACRTLWANVQNTLAKAQAQRSAPKKPEKTP